MWWISQIRKIRLEQKGLVNRYWGERVLGLAESHDPLAVHTQ
ncbi:MAG: hypothetical protein O7F71_20340 [Gammaproteobacteria bacterium]|nr:hypothetical protein [Gammaproteobacteria bacterium]